MVDPAKLDQIEEKELTDILEDMIDGFSPYGNIIQLFISKVSKPNIGCNYSISINANLFVIVEKGNVVVEFDNKNASERAYNEMSTRKYDNRQIKILYTPEETFKTNYLSLMLDQSITISKKLM